MELLTDETVRSHTIHDIVLPLPGYDVNFPNYGGRMFLPACPSLYLHLPVCLFCLCMLA